MMNSNFSAWNPWFGCSPISPSCGDCHAIAARFSQPGECDELVDFTENGPVFNGRLRLNADQIELPYSLETNSLISVLPHGDLFHEHAPDEWIDRVFDVMEADRRHVYQILTKRSERMHVYLTGRYPRFSAPSHIAIGVSIESQREANRRVRDLLASPADFRWLIIFALQEPIDIAAIPDVSVQQLSSIQQVMMAESIAGKQVDAAWYDDVRKYFDTLQVPVTSHVVADEVAKYGF